MTSTNEPLNCNYERGIGNTKNTNNHVTLWNSYHYLKVKKNYKLCVLDL